MIKRPLQFTMPATDKRDLVRDIERRGLTQQQVFEHLATADLARIREGKEPSYASLRPAS
ncbi:hypothetical protein SH661x_000404 [Planctomicrobium sp. SH661]|uniref:hypothetical protein n=1 Tax=Planctomicrobium sp. SH661 TaxID=3448124 RepID=UPI003F5B266C